jgi:hypothetical protein
MPEFWWNGVLSFRLDRRLGGIPTIIAQVFGVGKRNLNFSNCCITLRYVESRFICFELIIGTKSRSADALPSALCHTFSFLSAFGETSPRGRAFYFLLFPRLLR